MFDTVEVNSTFYRLARPSAVEQWLRQTPEDFVFAVKASRYMTHMKRLRDLAPSMQRFYDGIRPLADSPKLGPVLWQLPERTKADVPLLSEALDQLPPGRHCFEFRHPSWFSDEVLELLRFHDVALVIAHHPERPFQPHEVTAGWTFLRFHFGARGRRGNYSETELREWAERVRALAEHLVAVRVDGDHAEAAALQQPRDAVGVPPRAGREADHRPGAGLVQRPADVVFHALSLPPARAAEPRCGARRPPSRC